MYNFNYLKRKSDKNVYPCAVLKSSSNTCDTSEESFKKYDTVTNISTTSKGLRSAHCCIF